MNIAEMKKVLQGLPDNAVFYLRNDKGVWSPVKEATVKWQETHTPQQETKLEQIQIDLT